MSVVSKICQILCVVSFLCTFSFSKELKQFKYLVPNMVCESCAKSITKHLKKLKRVKEINFDIPKKSFLISFNEGGDLSKKEVQSVFKEAGYKIVKVKSFKKSKKSKKAKLSKSE